VRGLSGPPRVHPFSAPWASNFGTHPLSLFPEGAFCVAVQTFFVLGFCPASRFSFAIRTKTRPMDNLAKRCGDTSPFSALFFHRACASFFNSADILVLLESLDSSMKFLPRGRSKLMFITVRPIAVSLRTFFYPSFFCMWH